MVELTPDGYVKICDRLKRFAKVSGEMILLTSVEAALGPLLTGRKLIAVLGVPDDVKGEKLVMVTDLKGLDIANARAVLKSQGFSELACPRAIHYVKEIPKLGNGKIDYVVLKAMLKSNPDFP